MTKFTFSRISSLINAPASINGVISQIEAAFDTVLSRDNRAPNQLNTDLDINSNRVINHPAPGSALDLVRLKDVKDLVEGASSSVETALSAVQLSAALLPTTLPLASGIVWNNGGVISIS